MLFGAVAVDDVASVFNIPELNGFFLSILSRKGGA